jgi:hypothetical protein
MTHRDDTAKAAPKDMVVLEEPAKLIVRIWHGRTPASKAEEYARYLYEAGVRKIAAIPGQMVRMVRDGIGIPGGAGQVVLVEQLSQIHRPDAPTPCEISGLDRACH